MPKRILGCGVDEPKSRPSGEHSKSLGGNSSVRAKALHPYPGAPSTGLVIDSRYPDSGSPRTKLRQRVLLAVSVGALVAGARRPRPLCPPPPPPPAQARPTGRPHPPAGGSFSPPPPPDLSLALSY